MNTISTTSATKLSNVLRKTNGISEHDVDLESNSTIWTENGTQTKFGKKTKPGTVIPRGLKQIVPTNKPKKRKAEIRLSRTPFTPKSCLGNDRVRVRERTCFALDIVDIRERPFPIQEAVVDSASRMFSESNSSSNISAMKLVINVLALKAADEQKNASNWHIVPILNPDGYEYTHTHDRMWRKNRAKYDGERVGVDLNRNFSCGWGNNGDEGSSEEPSSVFYRGPMPFSEPEAIAVRDTILGSTVIFKAFLSFHSYYELIIFPWGYKREPCPDYLKLLEGGAVMARAIFESSGVTYKVGSTKDMTYYACGTSTDWSYAIAKIPYSYMIELRSKKYRFKLPKDQIMETCKEILSAVKSLMEFIDRN
nr:carboxypeptidase B isoform X4 [Bombyx mori]